MQTPPPAKTTADSRTGPSLGTRIFLLMAAVIGVSILLSVVVTAIGAARVSRRAVLRALNNSQSALTAVQEQRRQYLRGLARSLARDPYLTAYAAEAEGTVYDSSILHLLEDRRQEFGFGFAIVLDPEGRVLARTDRPGAAPENLAQAPLVAAALQRGEGVGIWQENGALYDAVALPLAKETTLFGLFVIGFPIDDSQALEMKRLSGTDVVYLALGDAEAAVVASTLDAPSQTQLLAALRRKGLAGGSSLAAHGGAPLELDVDGHDWIALVRPLQAEPSPAVAMALAPLDIELRAFHQIEQLLVGAGVVAMLLALALSYGLSRRTLRPVRQLAVAAAAARQGDYDQQVEVSGNDEVAELAQTFNTLLADLREKRDMQSYIESLSRAMPAPLTEAVHGASAEGATSTEPALPVAGSSSPKPTQAAHGGAPEPAAHGSAPVAAVAPTLATGSGARDQEPPPPPPPPPPLAGLQPGTVLGGRYEILSTLGTGGMGVVLKAHDRHLDEIIALKVLRAEIARDQEMLERLKSELKLARKITHQNVLRTFDFLELNGIPCISMEYVHGSTLRSLLARSGRLPYSAGLHLARQLGAGLAAAHAQDIIHRDIKPENIILQSNGNAKLMDFGLARPVVRLVPGMTQAGFVVGTPHYVAPEQLTGANVDQRADIYASGVLLYEVFTGRRPFRGEDPYEVLAQQLKATPTPPRVHWPEIPEELERLLLRCLEREPERRFSHGADLLRALESLRDEPRRRHG